MALTAAALFGVSGVVALDAFDQVSAVTMTQFRTLATALILGVLAVRRPVSIRRHLGGLTLLGGFLAAVTITYYVAIQRLGMGPGVTIQFLGPALVLVWMRLVQHRPVPAAAWAAAAIAVAGTGLMNEAWDLPASDPVGILAGLGAAVTFAGYLVVGERLGRSLPAMTVGAVSFGVAAVIWLAIEPPGLPQLTPGVWGQLVWVAVAGTALPFLLELAALRRSDPGRIGVVATAEPVVGAAAAWLALGQALSWVQVFGGVLVVIGISIIQLVTRSLAPDVPDLVV
jgi:drug/metabolite transporter (DMT)-like permease